MIKKPPTKADIREQIEQEMENFLNRGHQVQQIPRGLSGRDLADGPLKPEPWQLEKSQTHWTHIPEVVEKLEQRRAQKKIKVSTLTKTKKPRKKLIYDDFGEPLRWVWEE